MVSAGSDRNKGCRGRWCFGLRFVPTAFGRSMNWASQHIGLVALGTSLLSVPAVEAVTVRIAVVGVNGVKLGASTSSIQLARGDSVEAEILVSGWAGEISGLKVWQVTLNIEAIVFEEPPTHCGAIKPFHFDEPPLRPAGAFSNHRGNPDSNGRGVCDAAATNAGKSCVNMPVVCRPMCIGGTDDGASCDAGCPGGVCSEPMCVDGLCVDSLDSGRNGGLCATETNQCIGGECVSREDFIMAGGPSLCAEATFSNLYKYGCTVFGGPPVVDTGGEFYAGTILLEVGQSAIGTFTFEAVASPGLTFFSSFPPLSEADAPITTVPLEMIVLAPSCDSVGACCDTTPGGGAPCVDDVLAADCGGTHNEFTVDADCAAAPVCEEVSGACCDGLTGTCSQGLILDCQGQSQVWVEGESCSQVDCSADPGACCDGINPDPLAPEGVCVNGVTWAGCQGEGKTWHKGEVCSAVSCDAEFQSIPAVSEWGLVLLAIALLILAKVTFGRRADRA